MRVFSAVSLWVILGCSCTFVWAARKIDNPVFVPPRQLGSYNHASKQVPLNTQRSVPYHALALQKNAHRPSLVTPLTPTTPLHAHQRQDIRQPQYRPSTNSAVQRLPSQAPAQRVPLVKTTPLSTSVPQFLNGKPRPAAHAPVRAFQQPAMPTKTAGRVVQQPAATVLQPLLHSASHQRPSSASFTKGGSNSFPEGFAKGLPSFDFGGGFSGPPTEAFTPLVRKRRRARRAFRWPFFSFRRRKDKYIQNERLGPFPPNNHHQSLRTRPRPAPPPPPIRRNPIPFRRPPPPPLPPKPVPLDQDQSSEVPAFYVQRFSPSTNSYTRLKRRPPYKAPVQRPKRPRPQYGAPPSKGYGSPPASSYGAPAPSPSYSGSSVGVAQTTSQTTYGSASPSYSSVATSSQASYGVNAPKTSTDLNTAASRVSGAGDNDFGLVIQMKFPKAALSSPTSLATPLDAYGKIDIDPFYSDTDDDRSQRKARDMGESDNGFMDGKPANFPSLKTLGGFDSPFDSPKDFKHSASNQKATKVVPPVARPASRNSESPKLRLPAKEVALDYEFSRAKRGNTAPQSSIGPASPSSSASKFSNPTYPQSINDILNAKDDETENSSLLTPSPLRMGQTDVILDTSFFTKRSGNALNAADDEAFLEPDDFQAPINATDIDDVLSAASHSEDILEGAEQRFNPSIGPFGTNGRPAQIAAPSSRRPSSPANSFSSFRPRPLPPKAPLVDPQRDGSIRKPFSRNFDVVTGGLFRDASDYRRPIRPFQHNNHFYDDDSHEDEDDFFSNFRDFADINHRRRGEHSQRNNRPVWPTDASYDEEDADY